MSSLLTLECWPLFAEWVEALPRSSQNPPGKPRPFSPHPCPAVVGGRPQPGRRQLGTGSRGEAGVRAAAGLGVGVPGLPPAGPGIGDRAEDGLAGWCHRSFQLSTAPEVRSSCGGLGGHGAWPLLFGCKAVSIQGPGPSPDVPAQTPGPRPLFTAHGALRVQKAPCWHLQSLPTDLSCVSSHLSGHSTSCVCVLRDVGCLGCMRYWSLRVRLWVPQFFLLSLPGQPSLSLVLHTSSPSCTWPGGPTGSLWDCLQRVLVQAGRPGPSLQCPPSSPHVTTPARSHSQYIQPFPPLPSAPLIQSASVSGGPLVLPLSLSPGHVSGGGSPKFSEEEYGGQRSGQGQGGGPRSDEGERQGGGALGQLPTVLLAPPHTSLPGLAASAVALSSLIW